MPHCIPCRVAFHPRHGIVNSTAVIMRILPLGRHWTSFVTLASTVVVPRLIVAQSSGTTYPGGSAPIADTSIFAPMTLPPIPGAIHLANGAPGPKYWENRANYDLKATLDTATGTVNGTMVLRYTNHSPNTLTVLWLQTEQNRFRNNVTASGGDSAKASMYGDVIEQFTQRVGNRPVALRLEDHVSETKVTLATPLKPGSTATLAATWHFVVPKDGDRMDRDGALYQIAQWYPRVNVYDDVKGWNIEPYLGQGEFFLEYGDFSLAVTVPSGYIVAATGTLENPQDVLTSTEVDRLKQAMTTDTVVHVVTTDELTSGTARPKHDGMVTWRFRATNVRDVVWCASPDYAWDATHWKNVLVQAYYRAPAVVTWKEAADMVRMSIQEYSERWYPYPYPQVTAAEGPVHGMEYPMLSMDATFNSEPRLYLSITHEVGHEWFPMIVGSNERVHAWMDEGVNQFINTFSIARRYPDRGDQIKRADQYRSAIEGAVTQHQDAVVETPADSADANVYGYIAYFKPAGILQMLRRDVVGAQLFDRAMHTYVARWAYKHPTPQDFFRTMEDVSGQHLDWFWREWFFENPTFDQAIDSVSQTTAQTETHLTVTYGNRGRGVLPLLIRFTFSDGTTQDVSYPADVWRANSARYTASYTFMNKTVKQIQIDPDKHLVDADRSNNDWTAK